jgi:hypothetical protein
VPRQPSLCIHGILLVREDRPQQSEYAEQDCDDDKWCCVPALVSRDEIRRDQRRLRATQGRLMTTRSCRSPGCGRTDTRLQDQKLQTPRSWASDALTSVAAAPTVASSEPARAMLKQVSPPASAWIASLTEPVALTSSE